MHHMHALVDLALAIGKGQPQVLVEGSTQDTLSLMFAAVTPGRVENVDGPTRGVTIARGCLCFSTALLPGDCAERSVMYSSPSCKAYSQPSLQAHSL